MIKKDAIEILKDIQDNLEENDFIDRCALDMAIEALKDARPHGEWIPVSERLPEEDEDIIITHLGNMKKPIVDVSYFDGDFRSEDGEAYFSEVIAWMPLPEPYTRGEAE